MNNSIINFPLPANEPVKAYMPGSPERVALEKELERQSKLVVEIPIIIGGKEIRTGDMGEVTCPHDHKHVIARYHKVGKKEVEMAIEAAMKAWKEWSCTPWTTRAAIVMKMAELLATKYRPIMNAATMLGQSKNFFQAEIDSACETIDFFRYNVHYASKIYAMQPKDGVAQLNHTEYRPLEGFVLAVTPFNFTSIASNLCMTPVLMGNVALWKPSTTALLSNYYLMQLYKEAGLPDGVINFLPGSGSDIGDLIVDHPLIRFINFTGSKDVGCRIFERAAVVNPGQKWLKRVVAEMGGKNAIIIDSSANIRKAAQGVASSAFTFQGQKCSACSRAIVMRDVHDEFVDALVEEAKKLAADQGAGRDNKTIGPVSSKEAFDKIAYYIEVGRQEGDVVTGGNYSDEKGYYIEPTVIDNIARTDRIANEEIFGPVVAVITVDSFDEALDIANQTEYGLTGSVYSETRENVIKAKEEFHVGNLYFNRKCTAAVVLQHPFGGFNLSGTDAKTGTPNYLTNFLNLKSISEDLTF